VRYLPEAPSIFLGATVELYAGGDLFQINMLLVIATLTTGDSDDCSEGLQAVSKADSTQL
jgi:hypothetical protein